MEEMKAREQAAKIYGFIGMETPAEEEIKDVGGWLPYSFALRELVALAGGEIAKHNEPVMSFIGAFKSRLDNIHKIIEANKAAVEAVEKKGHKNIVSVVLALAFLQDKKRGITEGSLRETLDSITDIDDLSLVTAVKHTIIDGELDCTIPPLGALEDALATKTTKPKKLYMDDSSVVNNLCRYEVSQGVPLEVTPMKGIQTLVTLSLSEEEKEKWGEIEVIFKPMTEEERNILDTVYTLCKAQKEAGISPARFTAEQIAKLRPGGGQSTRAQKNQVERVTATIDKYRIRLISIDAEKELRKRRIDSGGCGEQNYMLPAKKRFLLHRGKRVEGYVMLDEMPLHSYSEMINQIVAIPLEMLNPTEVPEIQGTEGIPTPPALKSSPNRQAILSYLSRRIEKMKGVAEGRRKEWKGWNTIKYSTIFEATGTATANREQTKDNRDYVKSALKYWVSAGWVKGFTENQSTAGKRGKKESITIDL